MKVRVFSIKYILVRREETLELDGRSMKIPRKSQNHFRNYAFHLFSWKFILSSLANDDVRKIMEALMVALS